MRSNVSATSSACRRVAILVLGTAAVVLAALAGPAPACDICAIYTATDVLQGRTGFRLGLAEQYTHYATEQFDGKEVANPYGEHLYSSNTQVLVGYQFTRRFGLQLNLPVLVKSWRRVVEDGTIQDSTRGGIGDIALLARVLAYDEMWDNAILRFSVTGGLKFPTGSADYLRPHHEDDDHDDGGPGNDDHDDGGPGNDDHDDGGPGNDDHDHGGHDEHHAAHTSSGGDDHGEFASGVHNHDLAFGSGSVDGIVGADLYWSWDRFNLLSMIQYKATTEGSFGYQFANELIWRGGPGYFALLTDDYSLNIEADVSGETKGFDTQDGATLDDTRITSLYVGPAFTFTYGSQASAEIAADLPVVQNNTALQIVPDFRLRAALIWRF